MVATVDPELATFDELIADVEHHKLKLNLVSPNYTLHIAIKEAKSPRLRRLDQRSLITLFVLTPVVLKKSALLRYFVSGGNSNPEVYNGRSILRAIDAVKDQPQHY